MGTEGSTRNIEGRIQSLNPQGDGLFHEGNCTIAVARTVPGDLVRVSIPSHASGYVTGDLVQVLKPGPDRISSPCRYFNQGCGGCQWLHIRYARQLELKTQMLRDSLKGCLPLDVPVRDTLGMDSPLDFRNKLSLQNKDGTLQFMQEFNHKSCAPESCMVQTRALDFLWAKLRAVKLPPDVLQVHLRSGDGGKIGICLFVRRFAKDLPQLASRLMGLNASVAGVGALCNDEFRLLAGKDCVEHRTMGIRYRIPLAGFFQTNYVQARVLLRQALELLGAGPENPVLDLYCGGGYFSLPAAATGAPVLGLENNTASVLAARENAQLNNMTKARFESTDTGLGLEALVPGDWPLVLLDPPRQGCEEGALKALVRLAPRRMVYVSCSPVSLARDLGILASHGYVPDWCQPIDLFPHSFHVETLVRLRKVDT